MSVENNAEIWQVEVGGQIYEAPLAELPEWIGEGSLQPEDKVRKGNLRWIEARKVPLLVPFFNARANGEPINIVHTVTDAAETAPVPVEDVLAIPTAPPPQPPQKADPPKAVNVPVHMPMSSRQAGSTGQCRVHSDAPAFYVCTVCSGEYCKACPTSFGGSVRICPDCGSLCKPLVEAEKERKHTAVFSKHKDSSFGFGDLKAALSHPFKFKQSLFFGGLMFMLFTLGQMAASIGGFIFVAASLACYMFANMLTFGVLANTVDNFTQGHLDRDFMPSFDDFSMWDDVIHPFFLSIAVYIVSFGPFVVAFIIGIFMVMNSVTSNAEAFQKELARVPGTEFYSPDRTAEQSKEVQALLERSKTINKTKLAEQEAITRDVEFAAGTEETDKKLAEMREKIAEAREKAINDLEASGKQHPAIASRNLGAELFKLAAPLIILGGIALLWGLLYFPAACAVAGYSRSFFTTLNPFVGLDTIRRLGGTYVKVLLMGLFVLVSSAIVAGLLHMILFPFYMERAGNLPATALGSFVTFYFSIVFSCIIGLALLKKHDKLALCR